MKVDIAQFRSDVYSVIASIPRGKVVTYGQIAFLIGRPQNSRLVGRVMRDTSDAPQLPCHRVVNSVGRLAPHLPGQRQLLEAEGVTFRPNGHVDMARCNWHFMKIE